MKTTITLTFALCLLLAPLAAVADSATGYWNLPQELSDENVTVTFKVDTTWHMVDGKTSKLSGKSWLSNPKDPKSVNLDLTLPVALFDTDSESRDESLRESMAAKTYPEVKVHAAGVPDLCAPSHLDAPQAVCSGNIPVQLTIRSTTQQMELPYTLRRNGDQYVIEGEKTFNWLSFGVDDPSIFIAKVKKDVTVRYQVTLRSLSPKVTWASH